MKPSPAFQFYPDDFLAGTYHMSQEEVGAYIRLLCQQWNRGSTPVEPRFMERLAGGPVSEEVISKFPVGEDGLRRNTRLEQERSKQRAYREKQREKGVKSAISRRNQASTTVEPRLNHGCIPVDVRLEPEGNSVSPSVFDLCVKEDAPVVAPKGIPRDEKEAAETADFVGCTREFAVSTWNKCAGRGWVDSKGVPVKLWRNYLKSQWIYAKDSEGRSSYRNGHDKPNRASKAEIDGWLTMLHDVEGKIGRTTDKQQEAAWVQEAADLRAKLKAVGREPQ